MYVCICHGITERQIRRAVEDGATTLAQVQRQLPIAACCGRCASMARHIVREHSRDPAVCRQAVPIAV
jgi:bacterioferritin-associated ferredoxin